MVTQWGRCRCGVAATATVDDDYYDDDDDEGDQEEGMVHRRVIVTGGGRCDGGGRTGLMEGWENTWLPPAERNVYVSEETKSALSGPSEGIASRTLNTKMRFPSIRSTDDDPRPNVEETVQF